MRSRRQRVTRLEQALGPSLSEPEREAETLEARRARYRGYLDAAFGNDGKEIYDKIDGAVPPGRNK